LVVILLSILSSFSYAYFAAFRYDVDKFCYSKEDYERLKEIGDAPKYLYDECHFTQE